MQVLVLPGISDGAKAAEIDVVGHGSPRDPHRRSKGRAEHHVAPPACASSAVIAGSSARTRPYQPESQHSLSQISGLVHAVIDGRTAPTDFARVLAARANDAEWLATLGLALNDLGGLVAAGKTGAVTRYKAQAVSAARAAQQRQDALDRCTAERDDLALKVTKLEAEFLRLKDEQDFTSLFAPAPKEPQTARGVAFASVARRAREHALLEKGAQTAYASIQAQMEASQRRDRIQLQSERAKSDRSVIQSQLNLAKSNRKAETSRADFRIKEMAKQLADAESDRSVIAEQLLIKERARLNLAEVETEKARRGEGRSRAQASAAAEVLAETQSEVRLLRDELSRVRFALQMEKSDNESLQAANGSLRATVKREAAISAARLARLAPEQLGETAPSSSPPATKTPRYMGALDREVRPQRTPSYMSALDREERITGASYPAPLRLSVLEKPDHAVPAFVHEVEFGEKGDADPYLEDSLQFGHSHTSMHEEHGSLGSNRGTTMMGSPIGWREAARHGRPPGTPNIRVDFTVEPPWGLEFSNGSAYR